MASPPPSAAASRANGRAPAAGAVASSATPGGTAPTLGGGASPETIFDRLRSRALERDRPRHASLESASLVAIEGDTIRIGAPATFHVERLQALVPDLEALAAELFGRPARIRVELTGERRGPDAALESREESRRRRQAALNSEAVNLAIEVLDAEIVEIRPLGGSLSRPQGGGR